MKIEPETVKAVTVVGAVIYYRMVSIQTQSKLRIALASLYRLEGNAFAEVIKNIRKDEGEDVEVIFTDEDLRSHIPLPKWFEDAKRNEA